MSDLNKIDKEEEISIIKDLFSEMCNSRRQLKPILSEIVRAIDNNVFIDADSEEVKELLEEILDMQDKLSQVDELKSAISTKKLAAIDDAIREIDRTYLISELKMVLAKFKNLVCDSEDENEIDAAKKLKRQAHKLSLKAEKINAEMFAKEGSKFIDVAEKIEDPSKISSLSFLEIQNNFPENKFLAYSIMKKSLHFDLDEDYDSKVTSTDKFETEVKDEADVEYEVESESITENDNQELTDKDIEQKRIETLKALIDEYKIPIDEVLLNEEEISVEAKNVKKSLSV